MNKIIHQLLVLGFCIAIGQALQCYNCKIGAFGVCITTKTDCAAGEKCFSGNGTAVTAVLKTMQKGCLKEAECNKTTDKGVISKYPLFSTTKTCCNTDLCNAAPGLPGASGLSLALATITALLMAQVLV
ncbi:lymphocyte antigen 6 complex locus protein G6d-like [Limanda limanda]|uniref:lymphocyte antigen 6 complex locus protein G6d-like n=1 Tax=Limanda limanda TaxID=27771 RepID=UPI0029C79404|nr:lymphocyte antigen 6 complex locus protein G6d-like [Limanda limanda]